MATILDIYSTKQYDELNIKNQMIIQYNMFPSGKNHWNIDFTMGQMGFQTLYNHHGHSCHTECAGLIWQGQTDIL